MKKLRGQSEKSRAKFETYCFSIFSEMVSNDRFVYLTQYFRFFMPLETNIYESDSNDYSKMKKNSANSKSE